VCSACVGLRSNSRASHAEQNLLSDGFEFSLACSGGLAVVLEAFERRAIETWTECRK